MKNLKNTMIGIVGGAGPMASCLLNQYIVAECQQRFGCKEDSDFPSILSYSFPFSPMMTRENSILNGAQISKELDSCIATLSQDRSLVHRNSLQYAARVPALCF